MPVRDGSGDSRGCYGYDKSAKERGGGEREEDRATKCQIKEKNYFSEGKRYQDSCLIFLAPGCFFPFMTSISQHLLKHYLSQKGFAQQACFYMVMSFFILILPNIFRPEGCPVQPQFSTFHTFIEAFGGCAYGQMEVSGSGTAGCLSKHFPCKDFITCSSKFTSIFSL